MKEENISFIIQVSPEHLKGAEGEKIIIPKGYLHLFFDGCHLEIDSSELQQWIVERAKKMTRYTVSK